VNNGARLKKEEEEGRRRRFRKRFRSGCMAGFYEFLPTFGPGCPTSICVYCLSADAGPVGREVCSVILGRDIDRI